MFWPILAVAAIAIGLIRLGALSVWVVMLSLALKVALAVMIVGVVYVLWRRYGGRW